MYSTHQSPRSCCPSSPPFPFWPRSSTVGSGLFTGGGVGWGGEPKQKREKAGDTGGGVAAALGLELADKGPKLGQGAIVGFPAVASVAERGAAGSAGVVAGATLLKVGSRLVGFAFRAFFGFSSVGCCASRRFVDCRSFSSVRSFVRSCVYPFYRSVSFYRLCTLSTVPCLLSIGARHRFLCCIATIARRRVAPGWSAAPGASFPRGSSLSFARVLRRQRTFVCIPPCCFSPVLPSPLPPPPPSTPSFSLEGRGEVDARTVRRGRPELHVRRPLRPQEAGE